MWNMMGRQDITLAGIWFECSDWIAVADRKRGKAWVPQQLKLSTFLLIIWNVTTLLENNKYCPETEKGLKGRTPKDTTSES